MTSSGSTENILINAEIDETNHDVIIDEKFVKSRRRNNFSSYSNEGAAARFRVRKNIFIYIYLVIFNVYIKLYYVNYI